MSTVSLRPIAMARRAADDDRGIARQRAFGLVGIDQRLGGIAQPRGQRDGAALGAGVLQGGDGFGLHGSVHLLDEDLDLAAAGEADIPGLLVGDAEIEQPRLAVG